jgi:hypothetical protein
VGRDKYNCSRGLRFLLVPCALTRVISSVSTQEFAVAAETLCFICNLPCPLETCKIDEAGQPIHEKCYLAHLIEAYDRLYPATSAA